MYNFPIFQGYYFSLPALFSTDEGVENVENSLSKNRVKHGFFADTLSKTPKFSTADGSYVLKKGVRAKNYTFPHFAVFAFIFAFFRVTRAEWHLPLFFYISKGVIFAKVAYLLPVFALVLPLAEPTGRDFLPAEADDRRSASLRILWASSPKILPSFLPPVLPPREGLAGL